MDREKTSELIWQDAQHQMLFDLIDQIETAPWDRSIFTQLQSYAEHHFSLEEKYMDLLDYPDKAAHVMAHDKFRDELEKMVVSCHEYDDALRSSLSMFLSEWLRRHIYGVDKKFEAFVLVSSAK